MTVDYELYDDRQIVDGILQHDKPLTEYFFKEKCSSLFSYVLLNIFEGNIDKWELISELYLFMAANDWQVFRDFQYRSSLMTYTTVVAMRFFQKKRAALNNSRLTDLNEKTWKGQTAGSLQADRRMDLRAALKRMPNARYRKVIEDLDLHDMQPEELAKEMNITVDNLYNIHRRAQLQLRLVMGRKEDYV